ncbi:hypothetical protein CTI14_53145, partial [Methylobacterium radiotolerans]
MNTVTVSARAMRRASCRRSGRAPGPGTSAPSRSAQAGREGLEGPAHRQEAGPGDRGRDRRPGP